MSFSQKQLIYTIKLASGGGTTTHKDLRSSCLIQFAGGVAMGTANIVIYGMTKSEMNSLTTFGTQIATISKNTISVQAGDDSGMSKIFEGTISTGFLDASAMPEICYRCFAAAGLAEAVEPAKPTSVQGSGDVATIMGQLAQKMGLQFENNNVNVKLQNLYLSSSYRQQALELAEHAGIGWTIENGILAIWPTGKARQTSGGSTLVSKDTGMVGYPAFNQAGVIVTTEFNPSLKYQGKFTVQSELTPANGDWTIYKLDHDLEARTPHGRWFSTLFGLNSKIEGQPPGDQN